MEKCLNQSPNNCKGDDDVHEMGEESTTIKHLGHPSFEEDNTNGSNEMEQLRYRISQLEHLIVSPSLDLTFIPPPPHYSTINYNPHLGHKSLSVELSKISPISTDNTSKEDERQSIFRIHHLESLLAASELDNQKLQEDFKLLKASKNHERMVLQEEIKFKSIEIQQYKEKVKLFEVQATNYQKQQQVMEEYIKTLPSEKELDDLKEQCEKLENENKFMKGRMNRLKEDLNKTQKELIRKEGELQNSLSKLEELQPYEEAQKLLMADNDETSATEEGHNKSLTYFSNEENIVKLVTIQKAQLVQAQNIIKSCRTKLRNKEAEKNDLVLTLAEKVKETGDLQEQVMHYQMESEQFIMKVNTLEKNKEELKNECVELRKSLEELQNSQKTKQEESVKLLNLITQVELCCDELSQLVTVGKTILNGEEPALESLLGFPSSLSEFTENSINSDEINFNLEWILQKLIITCELRKQLQEVRGQLSSLYADSLAKDMEKCNIQ